MFLFTVAVRTLHHNLDKLQDATDASDEELDFLRSFLANNTLLTLVEVTLNFLHKPFTSYRHPLMLLQTEQTKIRQLF